MQLESTNSIVICPHTVLYGSAGSQKTRMIATLDSPVVCSTDAGLSSLSEFNIPFKSCKSYDEIAEFRDWTTTPDAMQFKTIVYDDCSEMCAMRLKLELSQTSTSGTKVHGQQAYGKMADEMLDFLRFIRYTTTHTVVLIFKETRIQDQNMALIYNPMVPGKVLPQMIPYYFGQVYRMESAKTPEGQAYPVIRCLKNDTCEAKDRSGKLAELETAHLGNIMQKIVS